MVQMNAASRGLNIIIGSHFGRAASGNHLAHDYASITCQGCDQNRSSVTPRVFYFAFYCALLHERETLELSKYHSHQ